MTAIAALDTSATAGPVLSVAVEVAKLFNVRVKALHVRDGTGPIETVRASAESAGVPLDVIEGPVLETLTQAARDAQVTVLVLGVRSNTSGRRPVGRTALRLASTVPKPVVLVPPLSRPALGFRRMLLPLEATTATASALQAALKLGGRALPEVVVLHVHDETTMPAFTDQPQHEIAAWAQEFLRRYAPQAEEGRLLLRSGPLAEQVLSALDEEEADIIALAWSQRLARGHAPLVRSVLERSRVPVLLLPVKRAHAGTRAPP
jgi:nucleotide-binding universal stress UspA family protein